MSAGELALITPVSVSQGLKPVKNDLLFAPQSIDKGFVSCARPGLQPPST